MVYCADPQGYNNNFSDISKEHRTSEINSVRVITHNIREEIKRREVEKVREDLCFGGGK